MRRYREQRLFQHIDVGFPGLQLVHEQPFIFVVPEFLTSAECARLLDKSQRAHMAPSDGGTVKTGRTRTSRSAILRDEECAGVRARIAALAAVSTEQLQPLKITQYDAGASFSPHTDAIPPEAFGVSAAALAAEPWRFPNRSCTVFIYLNDVPRGGRTRWRWLRDDPGFYARHGDGDARDGDARTPATDGAAAAAEPGEIADFEAFNAQAAGGAIDPNAQHESEAAVDPKHIVQQFIWAAPPEAAGVDEAVAMYWRSLREDEPATPLSEDVV